MTLITSTFVLGMMDNNTYLLVDSETSEAAIIDPAFNSKLVIDEIQRRNWNLTQIWLTHAHFDHIAGITDITASIKINLPIYLHPEDLSLYKNGGDASQFGFHLPKMPEPSVMLHHRQQLKLGASTIEIRHTPGHTPGHVVFYSAQINTIFCGDLIFYRGIGRTDLRGSDQDTLLNSIRTQILPLPPTTKLLSGHGIATNVIDEARLNPFLLHL